MDEAARAKWDERYGSDEFVYGCDPEPFLVKQVSGLEPGTALCLAAGEGRNAVYLAGRGEEGADGRMAALARLEVENQLI